MASVLSQERVEQRQRNINNVRMVFSDLGGQMVNGFPCLDSEVFHTPSGTPYLKNPGVVMVAKPQTEIGGMKKFLSGFGSELKFDGYTDDDKLDHGIQVMKVAGQVCYASFTPGRTKNSDAGGYIEDIKAQGHGSVLEHPNYSYLLYGISRSTTHELVRHRAGWAYSQLSQRYVYPSSSNL